jgi:hypothetical protein
VITAPATRCKGYSWQVLAHLLATVKDGGAEINVILQVQKLPNRDDRNCCRSLPTW